MKYFEFGYSNFEFAALIAAETMEKAINCYNEEVENLAEVDCFEKPKEITEERAFHYMKEVCNQKEINHCKDCIKSLENNSHDGVLMLIDGDLI